jgi:hypothetical protein
MMNADSEHVVDRPSHEFKDIALLSTVHNSVLDISSGYTLKVMAQARVVKLQKQQDFLNRICGHCGGSGGNLRGQVDVEDTHIVCQSLECGVYFERMKSSHELHNMLLLLDSALQLLDR